MASRLVQARKAPLLDVASSAVATRDFTSTPLIEAREAVGEGVAAGASFGADAIAQLGPFQYGLIPPLLF